jgi:hypothetical protein
MPNFVFDDSSPSSIDRAVLSQRGTVEHPLQRGSTTGPPSSTSLCHDEAPYGRLVPSYGVLDDEIVARCSMTLAKAQIWIAP